MHISVDLQSPLSAQLRHRYLITLFLLSLLLVCLVRPAQADWQPLRVFGGTAGSCLSGGCDAIWRLNQRFDDGVRSKSAALVGPWKDAYEDAMRKTYEQLLLPTIQHLDRAAAERLQQAGKVIEDAENGIDRVVSHAAELAAAQVAEIANIEQAAFKDADSLRQHIHDDVEQLLKEVDCDVRGAQHRVEVATSELLHFWHNPFDACYMEQHFYVSTPSTSDYWALTRITQCQLEREMQSDATVKQVIDHYTRLMQLVADATCALKTNDGAVNELAHDLVRYGRGYRTWAMAVGRAL